MTRTKQYYKPDPRYIENPCNFLHKIEDIDSLPADVQLILRKAQSIDEMITGDFTEDVIEDLINQVRSNTFQWILTGIYAFKVKVYRLYKKTHKTFEEFCNKTLGISHWMINGYIKAVQVWGKLLTAGFTKLPKNESQCRPLLNLTEDELYYQWGQISTNNPEHKITTPTIKKALGIDTENQIRLSKPLREKLKAKAKAAGLSLEDFIYGELDKIAYDEELPVEETPVEEPKKFDNCHQKDEKTTKNQEGNNSGQTKIKIYKSITNIQREKTVYKPKPNNISSSHKSSRSKCT